jgi:hypothetical protein
MSIMSPSLTRAKGESQSSQWVAWKIEAGGDVDALLNPQLDGREGIVQKECSEACCELRSVVIRGTAILGGVDVN